jgi:5'-deoxynucleotidase
MTLSEKNPDTTAVHLALKQALSANMLEGLADSQQIAKMPSYLKDSLLQNFSKNGTEKKYQDIAQAADIIAQYIESLNKIRFHKKDISESKEKLEKALEPMKGKMPEVEMFLKVFVPSCTTTIDKISRKASAPKQGEHQEQGMRVK